MQLLLEYKRKDQVEICVLFVFSVAFVPPLACLSSHLKSYPVLLCFFGMQFRNACQIRGTVTHASTAVQHSSHKGVYTIIEKRAKPIKPSDRQVDCCLTLSRSSLCFSHSHANLHMHGTLSSHHPFPHSSVSWGCFTSVPAMSLAGLGMSITGL